MRNKIYIMDKIKEKVLPFSEDEPSEYFLKEMQDLEKRDNNE